MKYVVKESRHYARPFVFKIINLNTPIKQFRVKFSPECFKSDTCEVGAVNKLFGWTNGLSLAGCFVEGKYKNFVHTNSFRIGWRANPDETITLFYYEYIDGILKKYNLSPNIKKSTPELLITIEHDICMISVKVRDWNECLKKYTLACMYREVKQQPAHWGYWLSPFHGGVVPSPVEYNIEVEQLKDLVIQFN